MIMIQVQFSAGDWRTINSTVNDMQYIIRAMHQASSMYKDQRVRAVDENGRLVDMM